MFDVIIVGGGPAGLTAGLYASRARLKCVLLERLAPGGQVLNTYRVENYPGFPDAVSGFDLVDRMKTQAEKFGLPIRNDEVVRMELNGETKKVFLQDEALETKAVILSCGATWKKLGIEGEGPLAGKGVSYCATCDGPFFMDEDVAVIGGGDTAIEEALFLTRFASKIYLIHRREKLRATPLLQERAKAEPKIQFLWNTIPVRILGKGGVEEIEIKDVKSGELSSKPVKGVFVFIGTLPNTGIVQGQVELDEKGFIVTDQEHENKPAGGFRCRRRALQTLPPDLHGGRGGCRGLLFGREISREHTGQERMNHFTKKTALFQIAILLTILFLLGGCSTIKKFFGDEEEKSASELMSEGTASFERGRLTEAKEAFQKVKDRYPYSKYAIVAELKMADALYENEDYDEAYDAYDEFERLHPKNPEIPYVIYQKGMCQFRQLKTIDREQAHTLKAKEEFERLVGRFPRDEYAQKARKNIRTCLIFLAEYELYVADYYYKTGKYQAALARYSYVIENYPDLGQYHHALNSITKCKERISKEEKSQDKSEKKPEEKEGKKKWLFF